jgi:RING-H2 zinc finger domain
MSTTCSTGTHTLTDEILSDIVDIVNARSGEDPIESCIGSRIEGIVNKLTDFLETLLEGQDNYAVLDKPSKAAMQGAISLIGETGQLITCTRPGDELIGEVKKVVNFDELEDIWWPKSLISWNYGIIVRYMSLEYGHIPPEVLLSLARFGEAQLCGASEEVMHVVLEDLKVGRYRTHLQWRELVVGDKYVRESYMMNFKGDMVRFTGAGPDGDDEFFLHELEFPFYSQMALQGIHEQVDNSTAREVRKIHYQAFEKKVDAKGLGNDDTTCPICLMEFENERNDDKEKRDGKGRRQCIPLYDVMKDNRQPIELTCGHIFGTTCIEKWLSDNDNCPLCRTTVTGRSRKLKLISQKSLSTITTYNKGEALLYYEDMEFDQDLHKEIAKAIRTGQVFAWISLEYQFKSLVEIDSRLGTSKRNSRSHTRTAFRVAQWMNEDWDRFATNALALHEYVKEFIRSSPDWTIEPLAKAMKTDLARMLNAHRQRSQL